MAKVLSIVEDNELFQQALINVIQESDAFVLGKVYGSAEAAMQMLKSPP